MNQTLNYNVFLHDFFSNEKLWKDDFILLDVGAGGGIDSIWEKTFGNHLTAYGFDPLVAEIKRLNAVKKNDKIKYIDAFITSHKSVNEIPVDPISSIIYNSSSAAYAQNSSNFTKEPFHHGEEIEYSKKYFGIDEFCFKEKIDSVDFIKIDTDGHCFQVLKTSDKILDTVLGVSIESQLHGLPQIDNNTFANIDNFMRSKGFYLYHLETYKYSRHHLPSEFLYDLYGQTKKGQSLWGDALYLRNFCIENSFNKPLQNQPSKILKLLCLYELFQLSDCVLEYLDQNPILDSAIHCAIKDKIVNQLTNGALTYDQYMKKFKENPKSFFPSNFKDFNGKTYISEVYEKLKSFAEK